MLNVEFNFFLPKDQEYILPFLIHGTEFSNMRFFFCAGYAL